MCEIITFFDRKKDYRCLSNFWEGKIKIWNNGEEREYESGEQCFHGEKFIRLGNICTNEERKRLLLEYGGKFLSDGEIKTSKEAKMKGGKKNFKLNVEELKKWNNMSVEVQFEICKYKLENYLEVREHLYKSKNCLLVHPGLRCSNEKMKEKIWEGRVIIGEDGNYMILGGNKLGDIWMKLRDNIMT